MENLTLKEIAYAITFLAGFFGGIAYFYKNIKTWLEKIIKEQFAPFKTSIDDLKKNVERVDMESCKNYLVRCLGDFEHGNKLSDVEQERFWEEYEHYLKIGGNSYIKHRVEKLQSEKKL
jgi:hypothetical protein